MGNIRTSKEFEPHVNDYTQPLSQPYERKKGVLEEINEKYDSLLDLIKVWDDEIDKNGYVN